MSDAIREVRDREWQERRRRAGQLAGEQPHAAELLAFYGAVLDLQEPLYWGALSARWLRRVSSTDERDIPVWRLERLPLAQMLAGFRQFLERLEPAAPMALATTARAALAGGDRTTSELLDGFVRRCDLSELARSLRSDPAALEFLPRAFLQPVGEALAAQDGRNLGRWTGNTCPWCGWPPQVSALRDETEVRGRRFLVCALCATWWPYARATCPQCGETDAEKLIHYTQESLPHLRIETCATCERYLKSVDLRRDGQAVPLVDDIGSVELDLWAEARGLRKICRNLLGW